ncbi:MAG: ribonuclease HII [archaeon]
MKICGLDEAGKGPVIGPLVICGVMVEEKDIPKLKELGAKDSKLLTPKSRERIGAEIEKIVKFTFQVVTPKEIDETLRTSGTNLNQLEAVRIAMIINDLNPDKAIVDCPSPNIKAYTEQVRIYLKNKNTELVFAHKADAKYEVVAAASILAKVLRDKEIAGLKASIGKDFGSGYPADPRTVKFIEDHADEYPELFRHEWATMKRRKGRTKLTDF